MKLEKIKTVVFKILKNNKLARNDDFVLYNCVLKEFDIRTDIRVDYFLDYHLNFNAPPFESVTRCRRKIQKQNPELASEKMKKIREKEQEKYIALSRE